MIKRKAYDIVIRCTLNGCEWRARLWLRDRGDAFETLYRFARFKMHDHERKLPTHFFRLISAEVSADQTRTVRA